jgi:hypothetical protein
VTLLKIKKKLIYLEMFYILIVIKKFIKKSVNYLKKQVIKNGSWMIKLNKFVRPLEVMSINLASNCHSLNKMAHVKKFTAE